MNFTPFSWYPIVLVATILSHRYNSRTGSGETKVQSHASSDTQPTKPLLLDLSLRGPVHWSVPEEGKVIHLPIKYGLRLGTPSLLTWLKTGTSLLANSQWGILHSQNT